MLEAGSWLPLGCLAVISLCSGGGFRAGCLLAFSVAMTLLAGHVQVAGYLLWAWGTLLCAMLIGARGSPAGSLAVLTRFGVALLVGAGMAAVQLLPAFELTLDGTRVTNREPLLQGEMRIRDVRQGPDGYIYIATDNQFGNPTAIVRLEPAD